MRTLQDQVVALGRGSHASEKSQAAALTILNARIDDTATTAEEKRALQDQVVALCTGSMASGPS